MKDTQILSTFQEVAAVPATLPPGTRRDATLVFDACHVGVVLRAVAFVELVLAVAATFGAVTLGHWLSALSLFTSAALPATLIWLIVACACKRPLARLGVLGRQLSGMALGAVAGGVAAAVLWAVGVLELAPWLGAAGTGALLAAVLVAALEARARAQTPATAAARLSELQARIRPHFLFNTLNTAIALVRAEPAQAETLLEDLSELFRQALVEPGGTVTVADEIDLARRYLGIEKLRFGERLQVQWQLDASASTARLPPLLLQPLVENAVKHGVEPSAEGGQIKISTQRRSAMVVIKVTNTLPLQRSAPGSGMALANVRERLALLHDVQGRFQYGIRDGVFQVRIEVPA